MLRAQFPAQIYNPSSRRTDFWVDYKTPEPEDFQQLTMELIAVQRYVLQNSQNTINQEIADQCNAAAAHIHADAASIKEHKELVDQLATVVNDKTATVTILSGKVALAETNCDTAATSCLNYTINCETFYKEIAGIKSSIDDSLNQVKDYTKKNDKNHKDCNDIYDKVVVLKDATVKASDKALISEANAANSSNLSSTYALQSQQASTNAKASEILAGNSATAANSAANALNLSVYARKDQTNTFAVQQVFQKPVYLNEAIISPWSTATLSGTVNNWSPGLARKIKVTSNNCLLSGIVSMVDGIEFYIYNVGPGPLTLLHMSNLSVCKFFCVNLTNLIIPVGGSVMVSFDNSSNCWRVR